MRYNILIIKKITNIICHPAFRQTLIGLFITLIFIFDSRIFSETEKKNNIIQLNKKFYQDLIRSSTIERDTLLGKIQNEIVQGRGYVESVDDIGRYRRQFRIRAIDSEASDLNIRLYLYADNEGYLTLLKKGDVFDYKGQFVIFTPLSSRKDSYIFDIILEEGALNIE